VYGVASTVVFHTLYQNLINLWHTKNMKTPFLVRASVVLGLVLAEEDHLTSLELGGNPTDPKNLWPQSYTTTPNAKDKDKVENYLRAQVCSGAMLLSDAQKAISTDWTSVNTAAPTLGGTQDVTDQDDN
jgi:hypothetical protein